MIFSRPFQHLPTSLLGAQSYWCSACSACSALGVLVLGRTGTHSCARPLSMIGAPSVPVLGVLCACRTPWSTAPALRCRIFHRVRRLASPGNQPLWFSGARQRLPWAGPVLGRLLAWPSWRVVIHSPQPLRRSVAIWYSSSAHGAQPVSRSACLALSLFGAQSLWRSATLALFWMCACAFVSCAGCSCA